MLKVFKILVPILGIAGIILTYSLSYYMGMDLESLEKEIRATAGDAIKGDEDLHILKKEKLGDGFVCFFQSDEAGKQGVAVVEKGFNSKYRIARQETGAVNKGINVASLKNGEAVYYGESGLIGGIAVHGKKEAAIKGDELDYFLGVSEKPEAGYKNITLYDGTGKEIEDAESYIHVDKADKRVKGEASFIYVVMASAAVLTILLELILLMISRNRTIKEELAAGIHRKKIKKAKKAEYKKGKKVKKTGEKKEKLIKKTERRKEKAIKKKEKLVKKTEKKKVKTEKKKVKAAKKKEKLVKKTERKKSNDDKRPIGPS